MWAIWSIALTLFSSQFLPLPSLHFVFQQYQVDTGWCQHFSCGGSCLVAKSFPTLCDFVDCITSGSSVLGIFQARILEWVVISFSRSSQPRDRTHASCIGAQILYCWATREAWHQHYLYLNFPIVHKKGAWYSLVPSSLQNLFLVLIDRLTHISPLLNFYHIHS